MPLWLNDRDSFGVGLLVSLLICYWVENFVSRRFHQFGELIVKFEWPRCIFTFGIRSEQHNYCHTIFLTWASYMLLVGYGSCTCVVPAVCSAPQWQNC